MVFEFEKAAMRGEPIPDRLDGAQQILYLGLRLLYGSYRAGIIDRAGASAEKASLVKQYKLQAADLKVYKASVAMWSRIETAATKYATERTLENADAFIEAVYNCKLKEDGK